jgi:hypothetical protein
MPEMKETNTYKLAGGDGGAYGPEFGPVFADEFGEVNAAEGNNQYLLLKLQESILFGSDKINFFVVSPRYVGDTLKKLRRKDCTVGVGRVLPGQESLVREKGVNNETVEYWSIGSCIPIHQWHK